MKRLIIGITAHVDSGKTTLSEALLYRTGEIRKLGRVDHQTAFLDTHPMERDRGITIFAHQACIAYNGAEYTLLDTPGHVDFSAETERTMQVLDYAILVISGTDGVQSHTETLWKLLERYHVPVFLFVNKMDLSGADKQAVLADLKQRLGECCADFSDDGTDAFYERMALYDETWMDAYLEQGNISRKQLAEGIARRQVVPCYFGAALKLEGVDAFLEGLDRYTLEKTYADAFGAQVFKIAADEKGSRLTYLKVTGGQLHVRDAVSYTTQDGAQLTEKISQIRIYAGAKFQTADMVLPGMVCAVTGLTRTYAGQGLGAVQDGAVPVLEPILRYGLRLPKQVHPADALKQLSQLEEEDPALHLLWDAHAQQIQMQLMGEVQLEVLQKLIADRFGLEVQFDAGQITYKETIAEPVEGVGHYEPLCHYAEVHLLLEPLPQGSGLQFASDCREDDLDRNWQRLVLTHLGEKVHVGVLTGSPITDMKITLCAGRAHVKHTEGGDFRQATYRAVRNGLRRAKSVLLEPWYDFVLELPTECVGRAMTDLQQMGADFQPPETDGERSVMTGSAPVANMRGYQSIVTGYTHGKGRLGCTPKGYAPCQNAEEVIAAIGYDCDSDVENTADSIFCAHGAGFAVKWDKVQEHMHLPSCYTPESEEEPQESISGVNRAARYVSSLAEDKELMAIFERTYGKIDRDPRQAMYTPKEETEPYHGKKNLVYDGEEYLLVDGYNIIFAWDELKDLARDSLEAARSRLIHQMCNYCGYRQCKLILVFDAYKVKGQHREVEQYCNISIVYTKESETADSYIEKTTHELCREHRVRVATSDGMEQVIILGNGALRVSADEFHHEVEQAEAAIRAYAAQMKMGKKTIREKETQ
ncbi:MAG: NYN domain-containing protein [Ruminococcus sp.]